MLHTKQYLQMLMKATEVQKYRQQLMPMDLYMMTSDYNIDQVPRLGAGILVIGSNDRAIERHSSTHITTWIPDEEQLLEMYLRRVVDNVDPVIPDTLMEKAKNDFALYLRKEETAGYLRFTVLEAPLTIDIKAILLNFVMDMCFNKVWNMAAGDWVVPDYYEGETETDPLKLLYRSERRLVITLNESEEKGIEFDLSIERMNPYEALGAVHHTLNKIQKNLNNPVKTGIRDRVPPIALFTDKK